MSEENEKLQKIVEEFLPRHRPVRVLEAGCGSTSHLCLQPSWKISGIDLSEQQLARNHHLQEKILGNLETYQWQEGRFDLIVCWDVLEHLPNPEKALANLFCALAPGGILVLAFPILHSIKGWLTKLTPYWAHLAFYRYVIGDKRPREELNQFATYFRRVVQPGRVEPLVKAWGGDVIYFHLYQGPVLTYLRQHNRLADIVSRFVVGAGRLLTLGKYKLNHTDCMLVLRKQS